MNILILNPPAEHTVIEYPNAEGEEYLESDDFGAFPPLGALYVLSHLEAHTRGHRLFFKDCVGERIRHADLPALIRDIQPDVVGITSFTISLIDVIKAARTVREIVPTAHICMGGHHPIAFPYEAAQLPEFDSIVVGEGEVAFTALVEALEQGNDITRITGVYTRESMAAWREANYRDQRFLGSVTVPPAYVDDLDALPFPNREYIRHIDYHSILGVSHRLATIISTRGCPYRCTFCDVPYKRYRRRSAASVADEVARCLAMGYREIHFYDDLFNVSPRKVVEFCDEVERRGLRFPWSFRGRTNTVTRESLERAKRAGCRLISFGVETGNDAGLEDLQKGTNIAQVEQVFRWCRELGILRVADFMIGLPTEKTEADIERNLEFALKIDPDYCQVAVLNLYPNTPLYDRAVEQGLVDPRRWKEWVLDPKPGFTVDHWEEFIPAARQMEIQRRSYRRFYFRPGYIVRSIFNIRSFYEFKIKVQGVLKLFR
ncbi:MAG: radical SAM protein [Magnetococcales bacterium]|nr:radical SAM protein [Magnetococcales bacterium]